MSTGVTATGFITPSLDDMLIAFGERLVEQFGIALDTSAQSIIGQQAALFMSEARSLWELAAQVYDSQDPAKAEGAQLDVLCSYTGTIRKAATKSTVNVLLVGDETTSITSGSSVTNQDSDISFTTTETVVLAAPTAWTQSEIIDERDVRINEGHIYGAIGAGTTASSGDGPTSTDPFPATVTDGSVTWVYIDDATGVAEAPAEATNTGPLAAPAFSLTRIGTPISGWSSVVNLQDATVGRDDELDIELRQRRVIELKGISGGVAASVRAAVIALSDVTACTVFENPTDHTDADGMPPHTVEALVSGSATSAAIAAAIFSKVAGGIDTVGAHEYTLVDDQSVSHVVRYSTPTAVDIYVRATIEVDPATWPSDGENTAAAAILAFGNSLAVGYNVEPSAIGGALFGTADLTGLLSTSIKVSTSTITTGTPANVPVAISARAVADFDSTRIAVVVVPRAP